MSDKDKFANALHAMTSDDGSGKETPDAVTGSTPITPSRRAAAPPAAASPSGRPATPKSASPTKTSTPARAPARTARPAAPVQGATASEAEKANRSVPPPNVRIVQPQPAARAVNYAPAAVKPGPSFAGSLKFRQTLIPPCLVLGISCLVLTGLYFIQPADSALRQTHLLAPVGLFAVGLIALAMAGLNMWMVRGELARRPAGRGRAGSSATTR